MKRTATVLSNGNQLIGIAANRDLRRVPLSWQHPTDETGDYRPLADRDLMAAETDLEQPVAEGQMRE